LKGLKYKELNIKKAIKEIPKEIPKENYKNIIKGTLLYAIKLYKKIIKNNKV